MLKQPISALIADILRREEISNELKRLFQPLVGLILSEVIWYMYFIFALVIAIFLLLLTILYILCTQHSKHLYTLANLADIELG